MTDYRPVMTTDDLEAFFAQQFPQASARGKAHHFEAVTPGAVSLRLDSDDSHLRPGGTVSGPSLFMLADYAAYGVILAHLGPVALAVTTGANIDFLRKPQAGPVRALARLLKLGKRLAVVAVSMSDDSGTPVAEARLTFSIPPSSVPAAAT
jgi:uncharacterized protein (TIGR00369 family)